MRSLRFQAERLLLHLEKNYAIYWQLHKQGRGTLAIPPGGCWIWFEFMCVVFHTSIQIKQ